MTDVDHSATLTNEGGETPIEAGPLSRLFIDNEDIISDAIDSYGPSAVSEFFISAGTAIAVAYDLDEEDNSVPVTDEEGQP